MRREIEIQSSLKHPNVMPILDFDSDGRWYVMPRALRVLSEIGTPVPDEELRTIVEQCVAALGAAHAQGILHRDIKPANILEIADASVEFRWVLGDWGLVRRPLGETTSPHTQRGRLLGTEGFAPPESYTNAHEMTPASDIYSLGRVVAWATTGQVPAPNIELLPEGAWRRFVRLLTRHSPERRPQSIDKVFSLLESVGEQESSGEELIAALRAAQAGDEKAALQALKLSLDHSDDAALFVDEIAPLQGEGLKVLVMKSPAAAKEVLGNVARHLKEINWGFRDFDYYNVPLGFIHEVAVLAADQEDWSLFEEACEFLFELEPEFQRFSQRDISCRWLSSLSGELAGRVAEILRGYSQAVGWYGELSEAQDMRIRAVLRAQPASRSNS
jgi:serine/threonine-protein kinase